ncbi:alpha/beta hydrolase family protein [Caulobacter sp. KR2-114]|uniref:alpha/beta hydrolase family protein n=1 Tax=Caulobacter sp. KR2-114 TaxID=3400912 RepID=UPI003C0F37F0
MISRRLRAAAIAVLGGIAAATSAMAAEPQAAAGPPALAAYGRLPTIEQVAIAPDGSALAAIYTDGDARKLVVLSLPDQKIIRVLNAGSNKLRTIQWAGPHHILLTVSHATTVVDVIAPKSEWFVTTDYNLDKGSLKPAIAGIDEAMNITFGKPMIRTINGHPFAFIQGEYFVDNRGHIALFKVDLDRDVAILVDAGVENTDDWLVDQSGQLLAQREHDARRDVTQVRVHRGNSWQLVKLGDGNGDPDIMGLGRDGKTILFNDWVDDKPALRELTVGETGWGDVIASQDGQEVLFDPGDARAIGVHALVGDKDEYRFFDAHDQAVWNAVVKAYPADARVLFQDWSADHRRIVVLVDSPEDGAAYAYVDLATHKATWLGDVYPEAAKLIAPRTPFAFKAGDGTPLTGYLFTPPGREARNLPLVVFPHGGPAARDEPSYDWWAQAMATRGYAVLQVNYRGSDGFGWKFLKAGFGQWGRAMQTDLSDGVRALAVQGKIDPKRVCIVGASYGGYAALAGATLQPDVYRCAASVAGPAELSKFVAWSRDQHDISAQRYWLKFMGADGLHDVRLEDISPADHADQVKGPVLLIHGKDDTVVPFSQSQIMADALKRAGKPYDLVVLKAEDHWLSRGETRLQMLQAVIDFLQKNNPPG